MKKLWVIAILLLVLAGCSNSMDDLEISGKEPEITNLAKVVIPLPEVSSVRAVGLENAKTYTNYFEVSFQNKVTNAVFSANASVSEGYIETIIPPGTYDILLFAGSKNYYLNYSPLLLASSYVENAAISLDETNTINMTLTTFDFDLIAPSKVTIGKDFTVGFVMNTKNPLIGRFDKETLQERGTYYRYSDCDCGLLDHRIFVEEFIKEGTSFTYSMEFTAPPMIGSAIISLYGYIEMFANSPEESIWTYMQAFHPDLGSHYGKTITFVDGVDVNVNINWPE